MRPDDVRALDLRLREDLVARDHHAHVDDFELLHWSTTDTMFLPMSCVAFTVAMTILPFARTSPPASASRRFSSSMNGIRCATACFITRRLHDLRQEHLATEQVADDVHPVHQRPFDHVDRAAPPAADLRAHSSVSSTMKFVMRTSACESRFSTGWLRHSRFSSFSRPRP